MSKNLGYALDLIHKGYPVFPCREKPGTHPTSGRIVDTKAPYFERGVLEHGLDDATLDAEQVTDWWTRWPNALVGVSLDHLDVTVIDVDVREGGVNGFQVIRDCGFDLPTGVRGTSLSRKGEHYWFLGRTTSGKAGPGIDRKSSGGYVIVTYPMPDLSEIVDEVPEWARPIRGDDGDLTDAEYDGSYQQWVDTLNLENEDRGLAEYVKHRTQPGIDFDYTVLRDMMWKLVAAAAAGTAGVPDAIADLKSRWLDGEYNTPTNQARFDVLLTGAIHKAGPYSGPRFTERTDEEWETLFAAAPVYEYTYEDYLREVGQAPTVEMLDDDGDMLDPLMEKRAKEILFERKAKRRADEIENPQPLLVTSFDVVDEREPSRPIWDGLLYRDTLTVVAADGGVGKTTMMLGVSLAMGNETQVLDREVTQGRVLFLAGEGSKAFGARKRAWAGYWGQTDLSSSHIDLIENVAMTASSMKKVLALHQERQYDLIVFDTFAALFSIENENDNAQVSTVMRQLKELRDAVPGTCVVLVHHTTNSTDARGRKFSKARGASAIRNDSDTVLMASGTRESLFLSTDPEHSGKQRDAEPVTIKNLCLRKVGGHVVLTEQNSTEEMRERTRIVHFLQAFGGMDQEWGSEALQRHAGVSSKATYENLRREAIERGWVVKGEGNKGKYRLTQAGFIFASTWSEPVPTA